ncbi:MAG: tripartite tricarboxylate transporter substrate binding protein [Cytophagales bacterium]|nr:tripartite tricarboxylate transporter substrate binding protein [Rhizobacter sp.]
MKRRSLLLVLAPAALFGPTAHADTSTLRIVVPFPPGGATDTVARLIAPLIARELTQTVVIDNRSGAGGSLGMAEVARAAPDGLTLGLATVSTHGVNPVVYKRLPYDALRDFTPIAELVRAPGVLVVNPQLPVRSLAELLAHARAHPGRLTYGTPGVGSAGHMAGERLKKSAKVHLVHIPHRGASGVMTDLISGQIDIGFDQVASSLPHIQAGRLRALAISWATRLPQLPDVPSFAEAGLPDNNDPSWFGIVAPAKTPEAVVARLNAALLRALNQPELKAQCEKLGLYVTGSTPKAFGNLIQATMEQMRETARSANISLDS